MSSHRADRRGLSRRSSVKSTPRATGKRVAAPSARRAVKSSKHDLTPELREVTTALETALESALESALETGVGTTADTRPGAPETPLEVTRETTRETTHDVTRATAVATTELPPARAAAARDAGGKRRAHRGSTRGRLVRLPSLPLAAGIAALAVSAGGAVTAANPALLSASGNEARVNQASAMGGDTQESRTSLISQRKAAVSRDSRRDALADAADQQLVQEAEAQAQERNAALAKFAKQAESQAAKLALNQWVLPLDSYRLTAEFGDYGLWASYHTGLDFSAPTGTPIRAVAGGEVTEVGYDGSYGNKTVITLDDGTELWYCHQNEFGTEVGEVVESGDVIGYVGSTGNTTGPHLHLEVRPGGGDPVDPYAALVVHGLQP